MTDESATELPSEIRWSDPHKGPYLITVRFRPDAKDWQAVGVSIGFVDAQEARNLRTSDLRKLRLPQIIEQAAAKLRVLTAGGTTLPEELTAPLSQLAYLERTLLLRQAEAAAAAGGVRPPGRPGTPLPALEAAARIYAEAFDSGEPPTQAVAEAQKITHAAATRRIARARKLGLLGPAEQGKASVGVLRYASDIQELVSEIARRKELLRRHRVLEQAEAEFFERMRAKAEEEQAEQS